MLLYDKVNQMNPQSIAYIGDAVFSLFVRERLILRHDCKSGMLHHMANNYVKASGQAMMIEYLKDKLTESEADIVRRSRNTHTGYKAKNYSLSDYKRATALEGLLGFLYLTGQKERLDEILNLCANALEESQAQKGKKE